MANTTNITNIPAPRVPFIDERTGLISREWFRFLNNQFQLTGGGTTQISTADLELTPSLAATTEDVIPELEKEIQALKLAPPLLPLNTSNYGMFYDTTTQTAAATGTAYAITFNTTTFGVGVRRGTTTSQILVQNPGVYNFAFSLQLDKTSGGDGIFDVWFRKNGTNVPNSAFRVRIKGNDAEIFVATNLFVEMSNGDYMELMFAVDSTDIQIAYFAAAAPVPAIPSIILTVNQVNL